MHQVAAWNLESLTIPLPDEINELIKGIPLAQYPTRQTNLAK